VRSKSQRTAIQWKFGARVKKKLTLAAIMRYHLLIMDKETLIEEA
jgi:hypothetical protein